MCNEASSIWRLAREEEAYSNDCALILIISGGSAVKTHELKRLHSADREEESIVLPSLGSVVDTKSTVIGHSQAARLCRSV